MLKFPTITFYKKKVQKKLVLYSDTFFLEMKLAKVKCGYAVLEEAYEDHLTSDA